MHTLPEHLEQIASLTQRRTYYAAHDHLLDILSGKSFDFKRYLTIEGSLTIMARTAKDIKNAMARDTKPEPKPTSKPTKWILADCRTTEHQNAIPDYAADTQTVLDCMVELVEAGCTISIKRDNRDKPVAYLFYPDVDDKNQLALSANAPDGYLALAVLLYKHYVILAGNPRSASGETDAYRFG